MSELEDVSMIFSPSGTIVGLASRNPFVFFFPNFYFLGVFFFVGTKSLTGLLM